MCVVCARTYIAARLKSLFFSNVVMQTIRPRCGEEALCFSIYFKVPYVFNRQLRNLVMLFICINFPRQAGKDVTSRDSFLEIFAQTLHFRV